MGSLIFWGKSFGTWEKKIGQWADEKKINSWAAWRSSFHFGSMCISNNTILKSWIHVSFLDAILYMTLNLMTKQKSMTSKMSSSTSPNPSKSTSLMLLSKLVIGSSSQFF
jgi:hypothetical protein